MVSSRQLLIHLTSLLPVHAAATYPPPSKQSPPIIDLGYAKYRGVRLDAGVDQFLGMRFAQPPLGSLRFRAPRDPLPETSIQDASQVCPNRS